MPWRAKKQWKPLLLASVLPLLLAGALAILVGRQSQTASVAEPAVGQALSPRYVARGQIQPVAHARVGTLAGGVVQEIRVDLGDAVAEQQQLARVVSGGTTEVVTASIRGTVTGVLVKKGDTVVPGTTLFTLGDVSRLQVETTDLDEFVIAGVYRGQTADVLVDALGRELPGVVRTASIEPTRSPDGDDHYPVTIDLLELPSDLRPGMNVRVRFEGG